MHFYLYLFLLLALPLFGKQSERYYQEKFAREIGGQVEVVMKDGTRCDMLTVLQIQPGFCLGETCLCLLNNLSDLALPLILTKPC